MSLPLTAEQIAQLRPLVTAANYPAAYDLLKEWTADSEDPDVRLFRTWLLGAADVNQGVGPFAALIGAYNIRQGELRGWPITPADNQAASNYIGNSFFRDLVFPESQIPDMEVLVNFEPNGAMFLFENYPDYRDTTKTEGANWVGTLLISPFGFDRTNLLLTAGDSETALDTMDDLKNVLFAYDAFRAAIWGVRDTDWSPSSTWHAVQAMWNLPEAERLNGLPPQSWDHIDNIIADLAQGRIAAEAFELVRNLDKNDTLDHLMSAWLGRRTNLTTDETFVATASEFFQTIAGNVQRTTGLERLDDKSVDELVALAQTDARYRNALRSLSTFALDLTTEQYEQRHLQLFDPMTGQGDMTLNYLEDRTAALHMFREYDSSDRTDHFFSAVGLPFWMWGDARIVDRASGEELTVDGWDLGIVDTRFLMFGSDEADELTGGTEEDRLYGGAGNDSINGGADNDYLEGNAGADRLIGGANDDELHGGGGDDGGGNRGLYGGAGDDALYGEAGNDHLDGGTERDLLIGGTGADTLRGDGGHDWVIGGFHYYDTANNFLHIFDDGEVDRLEGGEGDDIYWAGAGDIIDDTDGKGMIYYSVTLESGAQAYAQLGQWGISHKTEDPNTFTEYNEALDYTIHYTHDIENRRLIVDNSLIIENFDIADLCLIPGSTTMDFGWRYESYWWNVVDENGSKKSPEEYYASFDPWWVLELDDNEDPNVDFTDDSIVGTDGDDEIDSGGGNDWLYCGAGDDALYNEKGCHTFPYQSPLRNSIMLQ